MLLEMNSLRRSHWETSLLCLLLLIGASGGMPQLWARTASVPEHGTDWQHCKTASQEIVQQLWKLGAKPLALETKMPGLFPKEIECEDHCDPESLGNANKMYCLKKISQGLVHYQNLLGYFFQPQSISGLQSALEKLSFLLQKETDVTEKIHPIKTNIAPWEKKPLQQHTLWRLQSFSVVMARVFAHSAALNVNIQQ